MIATQTEKQLLDQLYDGRRAFHGELHDHANTGGTSDGTMEYLKASQQLIYNLDMTLVRNPTDKDIWLRIMPKDILICVGAGKTVTLPD